MQAHLHASVQHYTQAFTQAMGNVRVDQAGTAEDWLESSRLRAIAAFQALGFPTRNHEDWKYTSLTEWHAHEFVYHERPYTQAKVSVGQLVPYIVDPDCYRIVLVNGQWYEEFSHLSDLPTGLEVLPLATLLHSPLDAVVKSCLEKSSQQFSDAFTALNQAMLRDGVFIRLHDDVQLQKPIQICHIAVRVDGAPVNHTRQLILAGVNSQAQIIESFIGLQEDCYFTNSITDIHCAENAFIEHVKLQQESLQAFHVGTVRGYQDRDSTIHSYSLALGGKLVRSDTQIAMNNTGTHCRLEGLFMASGKQHIDHHTAVDHRYPHGSSDQHYRGILDQQAHAVFNGKVVVHPQAYATLAHQQNRNLLLSEGAQMNSKPELEIYADDVKCSHGATVGQLDEKQLFYLQTKGIQYPTAWNLLTYAFASTMISRLPSLALHQYAQNALLARLPLGTALQDIII